jgi:Fibronectin type III domain
MPVPATPDPPFLYNDAIQPSDLSRGASFLRLNWRTASDVRSYEIRFINSSTGSVDIRSNVSSITTFSGLQENTKYLISLQGKNTDGASSWSQNLEVFTRPATPTGLRLIGSDEQSRGFDSLQLTWNSAGTRYQYDLRFNQSTEIRDQVSGSAVASLQPDTVYSIEVRARDATVDNSSFWSASFVTITRPLTPEAIADPVLGAFSSTIVLEWELQSIASSYIQLRQKVDGEEELLISKGELKQSYILQGYEYGKEQLFSLRLVIPRSQAPGGLNESFWSPETLITSPFPPGLFDMIESSKYNALGIFNRFPKVL